MRWWRLPREEMAKRGGISWVMMARRKKVTWEMMCAWPGRMPACHGSDEGEAGARAWAQGGGNSLGRKELMASFGGTPTEVQGARGRREARGGRAAQRRWRHVGLGRGEGVLAAVQGIRR